MQLISVLGGADQFDVGLLRVLNLRPATYAAFFLIAIATLNTGCGNIACALLPASPPTAVISADRHRLSQAPGSSLETQLSVSPVKGLPPYSFEWSVVDPAGSRAEVLLDSTDTASTNFTAGEIEGPYEVFCTVTDSCGRAYTAGVVLHVGGQVGLDISTERVGVVAGGGVEGQTTIQLSPSAGIPPFDVSWTCTRPDGHVDNDRLDTTDPLMPVFTSSDELGIYILTATITDSSGDTSVESVIVVVGEVPGLDITVDRPSIVPGGGEDGMARLLATPIGGVEPITYDWEIIDSQGEIRNELLWDTTARSPVFQSPDETGTYLARCAATDVDGVVLIGSTTIQVGRQVTVNVESDRMTLPAGESDGAEAALTAEVLGGSDPVDVEWAVSGPNGRDYTDLLDRDDGMQVVLAPGTVPGLYAVRCTVTDADGVSAADTVVLTMGGTLGLLVTADRTSLATGGGSLYGSSELTATTHGGASPYTYSWSVVDPSGNQASARLDSTNRDSTTFASSSTVGLHTVMCTVTDALGDVAADSIAIVVGQPLNVDVTVDRQSLVPGGGVSGQAQLLTTVNGGAAPYSYTWAVRDPDGVTAPTRLSDLTAAAPVFTSAAITGTYRLTLTTSDATGVVFVDSAEVVVSGSSLGTAGFSVDVATNRLTIAPSGGTATLTAFVTGGIAPITYAWTITDPSGAVDNTRIDSTSNFTATFTSAAMHGTYRAVCIATDDSGSTFTDSVQLTVSDAFTLDVSSDVTHVSPGGTVNLLADHSGGSPNFTYLWSCVDDSSVASGTFGSGATGVGAALQTVADDATNTWTAPAAGPGTLGSYRLSVIATDAGGHSFVDTVMITVTDAFSLDVSASATHVSPGGSVNLSADRTGGSSDFTFAFSAVNAGNAASGTFTTGSTGVGAASIVAADDTTNVWTAPNSGAGTLGTYRIIITATDAGGVSFTDTVHVVVSDPFSVNVTANSTVAAPGTATTVTADRSGGETTFSFVWNATDSSGAAAGSFATGSTGVGAATQAGEADDAANSWTAPAAAAGVTGSYTITCVATDALGSTYTDSTAIVVGADDILALDIAVDKVSVAPGGVVNLTVDQTGGATPFAYAYTAVNESNAAAGTLGAASQSGVAGNSTNTWTAPAAAAGTLGTYRIQVTATDAVGDTFTDSVQVNVESPLSLDLTANDTFTAPSTAIVFSANVSGGETPYSYTWLARNSAGTDIGTWQTGAGAAGHATQNGEAGDTANAWSTTTEGRYTVTCTVTDNTGQSFTDSLPVVYTSQDVYSLDVRSDKLTVAPGELVNLTGDQTGGIANYTYAWSALNEAGAAAGTLGSTNQAGIAADTTNTWTAPTGNGVEGSYRIICTVTDASGRTFTDSMLLDVTSLALQNVFLAPAATATNNVLGGTALNVWAGTADPGQQITAGLTNPVYPRNVILTISDADNSITGGTARVTGLDARGLAISEVISIAASAGTSSTNTGVVPFATVTRVDLFAFTGADAGADQVSVGTGVKFGLSGVLTAAGDIVYVIEGTTTLTAGYSVDATAGQQGITFTNAPNTARNYTVVFRAR